MNGNGAGTVVWPRAAGRKNNRYLCAMRSGMIRKSLFALLLVLFLSGCASGRLAQGEEATASEPWTVMEAGRWSVYARENGIDAQTGRCAGPVTVLGHYPEYVRLAEELEAESMQIPMEKWDRMSPGRQWRTTVRYFNRRIRDGHLFRLATPVGRARPGSYYVRELQFLSGKGYRLSPDSLWLVR